MTLGGPAAPSEWGEAFDVADLLLRYIAEHFETSSVELPTPQFIGPGLAVPRRCEQLVVTYLGLVPGTPGQPRTVPVGPCPPPPTGTFHVELIRCVPTIAATNGAAVDPAAQTLAAKTILRDTLLLQRAVTAAVTRILGPGTPAQVGSAAPLSLAAGGGFGGCALDVQVPLGEVLQEAP